MDVDEPVPGDGRSSPLPGAEGGGSDASAATDGPPADGSTQQQKTSRRPVATGVVVAVVAVIVVGGVIAGLALSKSTTPSTISVGPGTATIRWKPATGPIDGNGNPPQPFTGSIEGIPVAGIATTPVSAASSSSVPGRVVVFRWEGWFGKKPFDLDLSIAFPHGTAPSSSAPAIPSLAVSGTWGDEAVAGQITTPSVAQITRGKGALHFHGTVGDLRVSGSAFMPTGNNDQKSGTATFVVTKS